MQPENIKNKQAIVTWAKQALQQNAYTITGTEETVQDNQWSSVIKFPTDKGYVYLKQPPATLFIETKVIQILFATCHGNIPEIIAVNEDLHCFIMRSCGDASLRTIFNGELRSDVLIKAVQTYQNIQRKSIAQVEQLLKIGVPDWRLNKYPGLYKQLIDDVDFLISQNLTKEHINKLTTVYPKLCAMCEELASYNIPDTLSHSDYHDNNMLWDKTANAFAIIDLGEVAIEQPLFSAAGCLIAVKNRYTALIPDDYLKLQTVFFDGWVADHDDLDRVVYLVDNLLPVHLIFAHIRLLKSTNTDDLKAITRMQNRTKDGFEWFINNAAGYTI